MGKSLKNAFNGIAHRAVSYLQANVSNDDSLFKAVGTNADKERIAGIATRLAKSPTGRKNLEEARKAGYKIGLEYLGISTLGFCIPDEKMILLSSGVSDDIAISTLAHEARHAAQFEHAKDFDPKKNIKTALMLDFAMEADAEANGTLASWELKELGDKEPYKIQAQFAPTIVDVFDKAVKNHGIKTDDDKKKALTVAFTGWYNNTGIKNTYEDIYVDNLKRTPINEVKLNENLSSEEVISIICKYDEGTYYTGNPKTLETEKFLTISKENKDNLVLLMEDRKYFEKMSPDESLNEIKVRPKEKSAFNDNHEQENKSIKDKALTARIILNNARQSR
ncbi:MAG: hypothetical protein KAJ75_01705 [Alphaproteobacteria bacterium]|nr:hypothetical protein [Alphaproteobacteria bacterium]